MAQRFALLVLVCQVATGSRLKPYIGSPTDRLAEAIQNVIRFRSQSSTRDAKKELFESLRRSVLQASSKSGFGEELEKYAIEGNSVVVLQFLLDVYRAFPILINRVEETLAKLLQCESWIDTFAIMYDALEEKLLPRTIVALQLEGDVGLLAKAEARRAEQAKAQQEAERLEKVRAIRTFPEFSHAMEQMSTMADRGQFASNSEDAFKALNIMLRRTHKKDLPMLLASVEDGMPAQTWEFLLRFGKRKFYVNQIIEAVLPLMTSAKWRQELLALPGLHEKLKELPVQAQAAFRPQSGDLHSRRYFAPNEDSLESEESKALLADALARGIKVVPPAHDVDTLSGL